MENGKGDKAKSSKNKIAIRDSKSKHHDANINDDNYKRKDKSAIISTGVNLKEKGLGVNEEFTTKIKPMLATVCR